MTAAPAQRLTGRVALVTGAATGIGAATARALARDGAAVAVNHHRTPDDAARVAAEITDAGGRAAPFEADVTDAAAVARMVTAIGDRLGGVDVLVNNAGVLSRHDCVDLPEREWDRVVDTSLKGCFLCCKYAVPGMVSRGRGRIINISSDLAFTGEARLVHYCAAKGGVLALTRALARELIGHGITVNTVAPGMTETPMLKASPTAYDPRVAAAIPAGRWGRPEEIAAAICFLASDDAGYFVGSVLSPNGGIVM
ncbi:glucose 1-dehydrogenase [Actinomadura sp. 9N215]|uniref:glucose 1-dehydrogenase n=1 Tax=Actinomadura sp. 9N215 TaxID=3375150 RepID=UPI00379B05D3